VPRSWKRQEDATGIKRDHIMERPGEKLKRVRERLKLTYRDVEKASQQLAQRRANDEFAIALSRLADIENKGTVPTIFRLYALCAIYQLGVQEVLGWYGVPTDLLPAESMLTRLNDISQSRHPALGKSGPELVERLGSGAASLRLYRPGGLVDVSVATSRRAGVD
jgi:transcriptional regulator with XRE-family HTH domain